MPKNKKDKRVKEYVPKGTSTRTELLFNEPIDPDILKSALLQIKRDDREKRKSRVVTRAEMHCSANKPSSVTHQPRYIYREHLCARNINHLAEQMRKAMLLNDWDATATLLNSIITSDKPDRLTSIITKTCMVLLLNHHESSADILEDFLRKVTAYDAESDIEKMTMLMCSIREHLPPQKDNMNKDYYGKLWANPELSLYKKVIDNPHFTLLPLGATIKKDIE